MEDLEVDGKPILKHSAIISELPAYRRAGQPEGPDAPSAQWGCGDRTARAQSKNCQILPRLRQM
jgi:hypothetical protein